MNYSLAKLLSHTVIKKNSSSSSIRRNEEPGFLCRMFRYEYPLL